MNRIGWSEKGIPTEPIKTLESGMLTNKLCHMSLFSSYLIVLS